MTGVASNIAAMLDDRYQRGKFDVIERREDAPLEDALALIARQRLTGLAAPAARERKLSIFGRDLSKSAPAPISIG